MASTAIQDQQACNQMLQLGSRSFSLAARLLPARIEEPVVALYAFCRTADDAIDLSDGDPKQIEMLRSRLQGIFRGAPLDFAEDRAFARAVIEHQLPQEPLEAMLEGFAWDAQSRRYENMSQLVDYAARVAGSVGILMALIMGERRPAPLARALDLGVAMQLTNICRDVGEDAAMGRLYLPENSLRRVGLNPDEFLAQPQFSNELGEVVEEVLAQADSLYRRAHQGIRELPRSARHSIRAAAVLYQAIGHKLRRDGANSVDQRTVVPRWQQVLLLLRSVVPIGLNLDELNAPVLPECAFLQEAAVKQQAAIPSDLLGAYRQEQ